MCYNCCACYLLEFHLHAYIRLDYQLYVIVLLIDNGELVVD